MSIVPARLQPHVNPISGEIEFHVDPVQILDQVPSASSYRHIQGSPASVWTITHGLGFAPGGITVVDTAGSVVVGEVTLVTDAVVVVEFAAAFSGFAYLS